MCAGFIAGIAFVYSCGGGGSSSGAATVEELEARIVALEAKLANVVIDGNTLAGLSGPHFIFSGVNVHVRNGSAQSDTTNGVGNIIVGYNESTFADSTRRTGSHNLVIGQEHEYSRYNGMVAGFNNRLEGVHSTVSGGSMNAAIGAASSVAGGQSNGASGPSSSVTGGRNNIASSNYASVTGGFSNEASYWYATVTGGAVNVADHYYAVVSGGLYNEARENGSSISGGYENVAKGLYSSVAGGYANSAGGNYAAIGGGNGNSAPSTYQSDETPDYDSGWTAIALNTDIDFAHNLGGDVNDYTVDLGQKETTVGSTHGINNHYIGGGVYTYPARADLGSFWVQLTNTSIKVWRNPQSQLQVDEVRIRIWKNKS